MLMMEENFNAVMVDKYGPLLTSSEVGYTVLGFSYHNSK